MSLKSKMPLQVWILTLAAFAIGTAEFVIAGILPDVASALHVTEGHAGNLIGAVTTSYSVLLVSRVIAGLAQGPFFGIGAVVATKLVSDKLAGQAVGQMFAGLTLANVLG